MGLFNSLIGVFEALRLTAAQRSRVVNKLASSVRDIGYCEVYITFGTVNQVYKSKTILAWPQLINTYVF